MQQLTVTKKDVVETGSWFFRAEQTPEPGIDNLISRGVVEQDATDAHFTRFRDPSWYRYKQQYTLVGNRFIFGNIIIRIARFHVPTKAVPSDPIDLPIHGLAELQLLDPSESWVVESTIRVDDVSNSTIADKAKTELTNFQKIMDGAIDLHAPNRLCLDTRIKAV